jgi:hypothetical protein
MDTAAMSAHKAAKRVNFMDPSFIFKRDAAQPP